MEEEKGKEVKVGVGTEPPLEAGCTVDQGGSFSFDREVLRALFRIGRMFEKAAHSRPTPATS